MMFGIMRDGNNRRRKEEEEERRRRAAIPVRQPQPAITKEMLEAAFVAGAKWWEFHKESATMWQSDQHLAWQEAHRFDWSHLRGPDGMLLK